MKNEFLEKVYGYKDIKKELKVILKQFFNKLLIKCRQVRRKEENATKRNPVL